MNKPSVRVELGRTPDANHIWVGDVDIRNVVTAVRIECQGGRPATVSLDLKPGAEVRVDGELVEAIQPVLRQQSEPTGTVTAWRHTAEDGKQWDLVFDTDDVASFETPINIIDITEPDDKAHRREVGRHSHMHLHFKEGKRPRWVPADSPGAVLGSTVREESADGEVVRSR